MAKSESSTRCKYSEGIDRISSLPEALHSRILSLLPTKNAVATSLLSKRWKFVWTCITNLSFDFFDGYGSDGYCSREALIMKRQKFTQFVNSVLVQLNPPCVQNFYFRYYRREHFDPFYLQSLICAAIKLTIQEFELELLLVKPIELPLSHFNCKTLSVLKLSSDIHFNVVASASICFPNLLTLYLSLIRFTIASNCSVSFPSLKDLHLDRVKYANKESVHKLFASCTVLDSLHLLRGGNSPLDNKPYDNLRVFIISIPTLRSLRMSHTRTCQEYKILIDTPALEYLYLNSDSVCEYFTLEKLSSEENISKFIGGLINVRFISISGRTLEAIGSTPENIAPVFPNLTRLELGLYSCRGSFIVLKKLLQRLDNLEHLIMTGYNSCGSHESWWIEPSSVPMCLLRRVTTISLTNMGDCNTEFDLVRYFLKNAEVLELFTIGFSGSSKEKFQLIKQKISVIPRGSMACQVEFR